MNELSNHITTQINDQWNIISDRIRIQESRCENLKLELESVLLELEESIEQSNSTLYDWLLIGNKLYNPSLVQQVQVLVSDNKEEQKQQIYHWGLLINDQWEFLALKREEGYTLLETIQGEEVLDLSDFFVTTKEMEDEDSSTFNLAGIKISPTYSVETKSESGSESTVKPVEVIISLDHIICGESFRNILKRNGYNKNRYSENALQGIVNHYVQTIAESSWNPDDFECYLNRHYAKPMVEEQHYERSYNSLSL